MKNIVLFIFIICLLGCSYENTPPSNSKTLNIPTGFDFSTHQQSIINITDPNENVKYDVYNYQKHFEDEVNLENDELLIDDIVYKHIISGVTYNGGISHEINLPKDSNSICIRRKGLHGYEFFIVQTINNSVNFSYTTDEASQKVFSTTVLPAVLTQDIFVSGNAISAVGINTNGYDLEVTGDLVISGFIDLSNSNSSISAGAIDFSGHVYLRGGTITSLSSVIVSGWLDGSGTVNYCTTKAITGFLNTNQQIVQQQCGTDSDGDGVKDSEDAYPNDATKSGQIFSPNASGKSTLAFEDLWPSTGDYDFNDLSFSYRTLIITNAQNNAVQIDFICNINSNYAGFTNAIGIEFENISPSQIQSISGTNYTEGYLSFNENGTEANQNNAVIIFTDNADNFLQETTVSIVLNSPIKTNVLGAAPFNPFIIANKDREREIHLAGYNTTNLGQNNPYITNDGLPWGLSIINDNFKVPKEGISILDAYNHFENWAISGGTEYIDWHSNTSPEYRNQNNIEN